MRIVNTKKLANPLFAIRILARHDASNTSGAGRVGEEKEGAVCVLILWGGGCESGRSSSEGEGA